MSHEIPIWQKANLTLEEAAAYYNIGINKLRQITDRKECEKYVLWVGTRRLIIAIFTNRAQYFNFPGKVV